MQKLHLFLKDTEVKKKFKANTKRTALFFISFFLFSVFQACIPLPPIWTSWAALIRSVWKSGLSSLPQQTPSVLEGVMEKTSSMAKLQHPPGPPPRLSTAAHSQGFVFLQCLASSCPCVSSQNMSHGDEVSLCCFTF